MGRIATVNLQERKVLFNQKTEQEKKSIEEANFEIQRDILFQRNLKEDLRFLKKELKKVRKDNCDLNEKFKKQFEKLKRAEEKIRKKQHNSTTKFATTLYLKRILNYLENVEKATYTQIYKECGLNSSPVKDGLLYLKKIGLIDEKRGFYFKK